MRLILTFRDYFLRMNHSYLLLLFIFLFSCQEKDKQALKEPNDTTTKGSGIELIVLGTLQDAGSPHIGCKKECCATLFEHPDELRQVVSLGLIDHDQRKTYLFEATPDISRQAKRLKMVSGLDRELPNGIFLTHAHIGHYSGLMFLGKEATNASKVPVYAMPKMQTFLANNGPWSQLVTQENIVIHPIEHGEKIKLSDQLSVTPLLVPHRDEFSETVGYKIQGLSKSVLFIPDIDKWEKWEIDIVQAISEVDYAFVDGTFFSGEEINTRDISEIPHPFISESMQLFQSLNPSEKQKIHFIHFNHTNPVLNDQSDAYQSVLDNGFNVAKIHQIFAL